MEQVQADRNTGEKVTRKTATVPRDFETKARCLIKENLWHRGTTYRELAHPLSERGVEITRDALVNKISRGRFSASFLLLCLDVLGAEGSTTST